MREKSLKQRLLQNELSEAEETMLLKIAFEQRQKEHFKKLLSDAAIEVARKKRRNQLIGIATLSAVAALIFFLRQPPPPPPQNPLDYAMTQQLQKSHPQKGMDGYKIILSGTMLSASPTIEAKGAIPPSVKTAFEAGQFEQAALELEAIKEKNNLIWYYLGYCYMQLNPPKSKDAIQCFQKSTTLNPKTDKQEDIQWFNALAHIQQKEWATALQLLKQLPADHYQHQDGSIEKLIQLLSDKLNHG